MPWGSPEHSIHRQSEPIQTPNLWHRSKPLSQRSGSPSEKDLPLFLPDAPLAGLETDDILGHRHYGQALAQAVLQATPPFTIGLFGEWGVGKTTIAKGYLPAELLRLSPQRPIAFVYFDVWKYQGDALRRQLLREVASSLKAQRALGRRYRPDRELEDLEIDVSDSRFLLRLSPTHVLAALLRFLLYWVVALLALQVLGFGVIQTLAGPTAIAAGALVLLRELGSTVLPAETRITRKQVSAADQFEAKFQRLMDSVTGRVPKVAIVLDNIDRCEARVAVEMLDTIKTFLEPVARRRPIFLVPCDIEAIRRHIASVRKEALAPGQPGEADEYLRKFFNAALTIQPLLDVDLRGLVERSLGQISISREASAAELSGIVDVTVRAFRKNPRRVKQFLNNFVLKHRMVVERDTNNQLPKGVSAHLATIAKVTVLEDEWPLAMRVVQDDPRGLEQMTALAIDLPMPSATKAAEAMSHYPELPGFLKATRTINPEFASAIARLKVAPGEIGLPQYTQFQSAVVDGTAEEADAVLSGAEQGPEQYIQVFCELLAQLVRNRQVSGATNAIATASALDALHTKAVANAVAEAMLDRELQQNLHLFAPKRLLHLLVLGDIDAAPRAITEILRRALRHDLVSTLTEAGAVAWVRDAAEGVAEIVDRLGPKQIAEARDMAKSTIQQARIPALIGLSSVSDAGRLLIPGDVLVDVLRTGLGPVSRTDSGLVLEGTALIWARCRSWAPPEAVGAFASAMTTVMGSIPSPPSDPSALPPLLYLVYESRTALTKCPAEPAAQLAVQLGSRYGFFDVELRPLIVSGLAALGTAASGTTRTVLAQIGADQIGVLANVLNDAETMELMSSEVATEFGVSVRSRATSLSGTDLQRILELSADRGAELGWQSVAASFADAARRLEVAAVTGALESRREELDGTGVFEATATAFIERTASGHWTSWLPAFDALKTLAPYLSEAQALELATRTSAVIESQDPTGTQEILRRLQASPATGPLGARGAAAMWVRLAAWAGSRPGTTGIAIVLQWLVANASVVNDQEVDRLANLLERSAQAGASADKDVAAAILARLPADASQRVLQVEFFLDWARRETGSTRYSIWRSAIRAAGSDRRSRPAKSILRELGNAQGDDAVPAAELVAGYLDISRAE